MIRKIIAILSIAILAGCATDGGEKSDSAQSAPRGPNSSNSTQGVDINGPGSGKQLDGANSASAEAALASALRNSNIVYFQYDSSELSNDGLKTVETFAKILSANGNVKLRLEGNTDERGSREYNIGLGERRANSVQSALVARGVAPEQLSVVSYGEERPADPAHNEAAWSKNRRVEIVRP